MAVSFGKSTASYQKDCVSTWYRRRRIFPITVSSPPQKSFCNRDPHPDLPHLEQAETTRTRLQVLLIQRKGIVARWERPRCPSIATSAPRLPRLELAGDCSRERLPGRDRHGLPSPAIRGQGDACSVWVKMTFLLAEFRSTCTPGLHQAGGP